MNTNELAPLMKVTDHSVSGEEFVLLENREYNMLVTSPQPSPENLGRYYDSPEYISHTDSKSSFLDNIYQLVKKIALKQKAKLVTSYRPSKGILLDIGAGTGDFLVAMDKEGWVVIGAEPNASARKLAAAKQVNVIPATSVIEDGSVDAVTMWHVLEHVPDVHAQISEVNRLLSTNGLFVLAVPNFNSYDAKFYGRHWAAYDVPRHLYHFSDQAIRKLAAEGGFEVVEIKPMKFDSYYVSLLSEKYKNGAMNYLAAFRAGFISNLKAARTKQYSSLIYVLKKTDS